MTKSVCYIKLALPYFPQGASKKRDSECCHFLFYFKNYIRFQKICLCVLSILFLTLPVSPAGLKMWSGKLSQVEISEPWDP